MNVELVLRLFYMLGEVVTAKVCVCNLDSIGMRRWSGDLGMFMRDCV